MAFLRILLARPQPQPSLTPLNLYSGVGGVDTVGESFYRDNLIALFGRHREGVKERFEATLVWERDSPKDPNAIAVHIRGVKVAHLPRSMAAAWRPLMEECSRRGLVPTCGGSVYDGWDKGPKDWGNFRVKLYMEETPDHDLRRLLDGPRLEAEKRARMMEKEAASAARAAEREQRAAEAQTRQSEAATRREQRMCIDCGSPIEPTGSRGRPPVRCVSCRTGKA